MRREAWAKALGLMAVGLGLTMVLARIDWLVSERQVRQQMAQEEVAKATARSQTLRGPYLRQSCVDKWGDGYTENEVRTLVHAPTLTTVGGDMSPQALERGLFKVSTYNARLLVESTWNDARALRAGPSKEPHGKVSCQAPELVVEVSDARGLRAVSWQLNGAALEAQPGVGGEEAAQGFHAKLNATALDAAGPLKLRLELNLMGTDSLRFVPAAKQFTAHLRSGWPHPSFHGNYLPSTRTVDDSGFTAAWNVTELSSRVAKPVGDKPREEDSFGVSLIDPINPYSLSDRALKYGFLFIALTLAAVMLAELVGRHRLHPVQYGFVGLALALFFLMLLALSEHLAFGLAYALAATAASALLAHYGRGLFGHWRGGALLGAGVALLYGALYVVLNLEKASLLLGTLLLFALLAAAMRATRDVDWYRLGQPTEG